MSIVNLKYKYQREMYAEIKEYIDSGETSLCYVLCMGLGKSYIFLKILEDYFVGKEVLYIAPKHAIINSLKTKQEFRELQKLIVIDTATFTSFNNPRPEYQGKYDAIFIDECHHCISPIQGKNLMDLEKYASSTPGKYVIGFSATPVFKSPYTRSKIDIRDMFHATITGITIAEAIQQGLIPKIKYAIAIPDLDRLILETGNSPSEFKKRYSIDSTKGMLENIVSENADIHHWLAFFSNRRAMTDNLSQLKELFPDFNFYEMYHGMSEKPGEVLNQFDNDPGKAMLVSIGMLLEGVHPKTAGGILLYRKPNETVFTQILGRLMDIDNNDSSPIFIDVMNVIKALDLRGIFDYKLDPEYNDSSNSGGGGPKTLRNIIDIHCDAYRYVQILEDLASMLKETKIVVDGIEISFTSYADLARQFGLKDNGSTILKKLKAGESLEDICRYYIQKKDQNTSIKTCTIHGHEIQWKTKKELISKLSELGITVKTDQVWRFVEKRGWSVEKMVNMIESKNEKQSITVDGETIQYESNTDLSRILKKDDAYVNRFLKKGRSLEDIVRNSRKETVTELVVDGKTYVYNGPSALSKLIGLPADTIRQWRANGMTDLEIIRKAADDTICVTIEGKEIKVRDYTKLANAIGVSRDMIYYHLSKGKSPQEIVDMVSSKPEYLYHVTVDGHTFDFNSYRELSLKLGRGSEYVSKRRHEGKALEDIIRLSFRTPNPKNCG